MNHPRTTLGITREDKEKLEELRARLEEKLGFKVGYNLALRYALASLTRELDQERT